MGIAILQVCQCWWDFYTHTSGPAPARLSHCSAPLEVLAETLPAEAGGGAVGHVGTVLLLPAEVV